MHPTGRIRWAIAGLLLVFVLFAPATAKAWKPYTHVYTGNEVRADLLDADGKLDINGNQYTVDPAVKTAIDNWPSYFNAGTVGPDGWPDIAYGQGFIHPKHTGEWMRYIYDQAWQAQTSGAYTQDQKEQILAFAYGYLIHAAGDMWAHVLVNDFAGGVFPDVFFIGQRLFAGDVAPFNVALRHIVTEGYMGGATPGWDTEDSDDEVETGKSCTSPDSTPPDTVCNPGTADEDTVEVSRVCTDPNATPFGTKCKVVGAGGAMVTDYSADSTAGVPLDAPHEFLQRIFVETSARTPYDGCDGTDPDHDGVLDDGCPGGPFSVGKPELERGKVIGAFLDLKASLQIAAAKTRFDANHTDCTTADPDCHTTTRTLTINTVRGITNVTVPDTNCTATVFCLPNPADAADDIVDGLIADYEDAWIADIDEGLAHWSEFGTAIARGLFDPQTRRDAAQFECKTKGPETFDNISRNECEGGVGAFDAVMYAAEHLDSGQNYIDDFLIPMLGLPDAIGDIAKFLNKVGTAIDDVFQFLGIQNPISALLDPAKKFVKDKIKEYIKDQYGIDIEALQQFESNPSQWMCGQEAPYSTGTISVAAGSKTVTGSGTSWTGNVREGEYVYAGASDPPLITNLVGIVDSVDSDTQLTLKDGAFKAASGAYTIQLLTIPVPISVSPPQFVGITPGGLFTPAQHARLDGLMGLESGHHGEAAPGLPQDCAPLEDDEKFDVDPASDDSFKPLLNTITMSKLLLLKGPELNRVVGDALVDDGVIKSPSAVATYGGNANIMIDSTLGSSQPWLQLIDGDHAWRQDGLPRFCNTAPPAQPSPPYGSSLFDGTPFATTYTFPVEPQPPNQCGSAALASLLAGYATTPSPRDRDTDPPRRGDYYKQLLNGGDGRFPIWESCLDRPAFRSLYQDWENEANLVETNFPDLGDPPSADASDPDAPLSTLVAGGTTFTSGGTTYVAADNEFTVTAADDVFTDDFVGLRYRVFMDGTTPGPFVPIDNGDTFSISGADGLYHVESQSEDPCHTFDATDTLAPGAVQSQDFVLDTTGPAIDISSPAPEGVVFDTDDLSSIVYTVTDVGAGVASDAVTLDGAAASNGDVLDMFFLDPGIHTIVVTATDNLGNSSSATRTFEVHATAESLNNNIDRACNLGLIKATLCNALKAKTKAALAAHNRGQHATEHNILRALVHQLEAKRGKGVDAATADRLIALIEDLIARGA